jgi:hypothetical protein
MSESFGKAFSTLVLDRSGEATLTEFAEKRGLPGRSLARWGAGNSEPRNGRHDKGLLRVLDALEIAREDRPAVLDKLFGPGGGYVGGRARAARKKREARGPESPHDPEPAPVEGHMQELQREALDHIDDVLFVAEAVARELEEARKAGPVRVDVALPLAVRQLLDLVEKKRPRSHTNTQHRGARLAEQGAA